MAGRRPHRAAVPAPEVPVDPLARAVLDALASDPRALPRLRELVGDHDDQSADEGHAAPAYTVDSLAAAVGVSPRTVRNAITRGELDAVKRGARWLISADAVEVWTHPKAGEHRARAARLKRMSRPPHRPLHDALRSVAS